MEHSTIIVNKIRNLIKKVLPILFWLVVWQMLSIYLDNDILLVSPIKVAKTLFSQIMETAFWNSIAFSFLRIGLGFLLAISVGIILAIISSKTAIIRALLSPIISVIESTPVASFTILALIWISSKNLSVFMSFLMVLPIIYTNVLHGIINVDKKMIEMAQVFGMKPIYKFIYIYLPDVMPFFISACSVSIGLCWKSGVAAEVIGLPSGSIGEKLYEAKIYLNTSELFSYTLVIIFVNIIFEKIFMFVLNKAYSSFLPRTTSRY